MFELIGGQPENLSRCWGFTLFIESSNIWCHVQRWHWERMGGISTFPPRLPSVLQSVLRMGDGREGAEGHVHSLDTCSCPPGRTPTAWSLSHTCKDWARVSHPHWQVGALWAPLSSLCLAGNGGLGWKVQEGPLPRLGLGVLGSPPLDCYLQEISGLLAMVHRALRGWISIAWELASQVTASLLPHHVVKPSSKVIQGEGKTPHLEGGRGPCRHAHIYLPTPPLPSQASFRGRSFIIIFYVFLSFVFFFFLGEKTEGYGNKEII